MADEAPTVAQDNVQATEATTNPTIVDETGKKSPSLEDAKQDDIMTGRLWRRLRAENQAFKANFDEVPFTASLKSDDRLRFCCR